MHDQVESTRHLDFTGTFTISRWQAWTPGITHANDWLTWLEGELPSSPEDQLDLSFLPSLLRRRLDRFGRMALYTAWPCVEGLGAVQYVFASRHGSLNRTTELLAALANQEPLSPTIFTLSVHNSVAGLFSIARGDRSAATAMAAGPDTLVLSVLECVTMIAEGSEQVLLTYADDSIPEIFRTHVPETVRLPFAISLLFTPSAGSKSRCFMRRQLEPITQPLSSEASLIRFLLEDVNQVTLGANQAWRLERNRAG